VNVICLTFRQSINGYASAEYRALPNDGKAVTNRPFILSDGLGYNLGAGRNTQRVSSTFAGDWNTTNIGFIGGIQGGFNYQIKSFVIGIEGDADYISESGRSRPLPVRLALLDPPASGIGRRA